MTKTLERAFDEIGQLPACDQERIGSKLLAYVERLRTLRAEIDEGIRSLEAGEAEVLDIEEFLAELHRQNG